MEKSSAEIGLKSGLRVINLASSEVHDYGRRIKIINFRKTVPHIHIVVNEQKEPLEKLQ